MNIYLKRAIYAVAFMAITGLIFFYYSTNKFVMVKVTSVRKGSIEKTITSVSSGTVEPLRRVKLQALLPLKIKKVNLKEGDRVKEGDVIIKLDDAETKLRLELQKAALTTAEFRLHDMEEQYRLTKDNYERTKKLYGEGFIPESRFDEVKGQLVSTERGLAIAKNAINEAKLGIRLTEEELEKTNIRAPFNGRISFLNATRGEMPSYIGTDTGIITSQNLSSAQDMKPFCEIIDDSVLKIKAPFDEVDATKIRLGQEARINSDTVPGIVLKGKVIFVSPVVSKTLEQNRTVDVEVSINKADKERLSVGASVDAEIILHVEGDVRLVPTNSIIEKEGKKFVYSVENNIIRKKFIKTGISGWESTEILEGIKEGDRVITSLDVAGIEDGKKVRIANGE